jgi:type IV fimbrial biogenesis protein FimT
MTKYTLTRRASAGFTLLELMVAVGIAAIVLAVGVPSFSSSIDNQRMTSATNDLVMTMNLAKSEAIKRVAYVSVCKSSNGATCTAGSDWNQGWIVFANNGNTNLGSVDAGDEVLRVFEGVSDRVDINAVGGVANFLSFRPSGTVGTNLANITGTLVACDERGADFARGVSIQPSGQWSVSRYEDHTGSALSC